MTPSEKEALWNCIGKMRSMPWKNPRGGTYNWTYREMRKLYEKLIYFADNNSIEGAWRFITGGKYSYMIYPWYRFQLINSTAFTPPGPTCVFRSVTNFSDLFYTTPLYTGTVSITDLNTSTLLVSDRWDIVIRTLQLSYNVWGYLANVGGFQFKFVLCFEGTAAPNWEVKFDNGVDPPQTYQMIFDAGVCSYGRMNREMKFTYFLAGGTSASDFKLNSVFNFNDPGIYPPGGSLTEWLPFNLLLSDIPNVTKHFTILAGRDTNILITDNLTDLQVVICNAYEYMFPALFTAENIATSNPASSSNNGVYPYCSSCYWVTSSEFTVPVGAGRTIISANPALNGLPADDPNTYVTIASTYNGYAYSYIFAGFISFIIVLDTSYFNLPTFSISGPGGPNVFPTSFTVINTTCNFKCYEVIIPDTDPFMDLVNTSIFNVSFFALLLSPLDLSDTVNSQILLDSIYKSIYGPQCSVTVQADPIGGIIKVTVISSLEEAVVTGPYFTSNSLNQYYFTDITCP